MTARLSPAQRRTLDYLARVRVATLEGIYDAGVSDATKRTLWSLLNAGLVESLTIPGGLIAYRLMPAGLAMAKARA